VRIWHDSPDSSPPATDMKAYPNSKTGSMALSKVDATEPDGKVKDSKIYEKNTP